MYKCKNCGCRFDEPKTIHTSWENYYGIGDMFENHTPKTMYVCPECNDDEYDDFYEDDEDDWNEDWEDWEDD